MAETSKASKGNDTSITTDAAPTVRQESTATDRTERENTLRESVARLQAHNDQLVSQVIALGGRPVEASEAKFVLSEGVAQDIEEHGSAVDPVTGKRLTRRDLPAGRAERSGRDSAADSSTR